MKSLLVMSCVVARQSADVRLHALPNRMPSGLIRDRFPFKESEPKICEEPRFPVTRSNSTESRVRHHDFPSSRQRRY